MLEKESPNKDLPDITDAAMESAALLNNSSIQLYVNNLDSCFILQIAPMSVI
jgi:hypothetical protein